VKEATRAFLFWNEGKKMKRLIAFFSLIALAAIALDARADDLTVELRYENRRFTPRTITVPANQPFKIKVINASKEAIEFESFKLNREKVVRPGGTATINMPALKPGTYDFNDDFHDDVPAGEIIVK
jgi:hypothetical protein